MWKRPFLARIGGFDFVQHTWFVEFFIYRYWRALAAMPEDQDYVVYGGEQSMQKLTATFGPEKLRSRHENLFSWQYNIW